MRSMFRHAERAICQASVEPPYLNDQTELRNAPHHTVGAFVVYCHPIPVGRSDPRPTAHVGYLVVTNFSTSAGVRSYVSVTRA